MEIFKRAVIEKCKAVINAKIQFLQDALNSAQEAANNETKSSAGDKFETGRAMMHFEQEKLTNQFADSSKLQESLYRAEQSPISSAVQFGSLIKTNNGCYYLAVGLGKIEVENETVFAISPLSPIGTKLIGKSSGDCFDFNNQQIEILSVC